MSRLERGIEGLDCALVRRVVEQLDTMEPEATAVLLTGSYAKGTAAEASDLDLTAITPSQRVGYRTRAKPLPRRRHPRTTPRAGRVARDLGRP